MDEELLKNNQLAENAEVDYENEIEVDEPQKKRELLEKTKISKQTWSILEIRKKINDKILILDPVYQRGKVWKKDKQTAFIESLYMGIVVPPIYVVEILGNDFLDEIKYEVVDGKQRLTSIDEYINDKLKLDSKSLEYYSDWFGNKKFSDVKEEYNEIVKSMLSQVLDVYVITANSPEFTKYDIFSRLNKGAVQLSVNEIRRAIYRSDLLDYIDKYVAKHQNDLIYKEIFSEKMMERYEDYGTFYRAIASYVNTDLESGILKNYKSRPREMINSVLEKYKEKNEEVLLKDEVIEKILDKTIYLLKEFSEERSTYYLDACIRCAVDFDDKFNDELIKIIKSDKKIQNTFIKSPSTTKNVNDRIKRIMELVTH